MKRLTMSLDDELADAFEALVRSRGYENRSEAFRDLLRQDLGNVRLRERPDDLRVLQNMAIACSRIGRRSFITSSGNRRFPWRI